MIYNVYEVRDVGLHVKSNEKKKVFTRQQMKCVKDDIKKGLFVVLNKMHAHTNTLWHTQFHG